MAGQPVRAYVGFGANLGDPISAFAAALKTLATLPDTTVPAHSSLYRSAPIGVGPDHPDYLNAVIALDTKQTPHQLLDALLAIEAAGGRTRTAALAPRLVDLDLLLYGDNIIRSNTLILPHPRMHERAFTLIPLAEIAPQVLIPGLGPLNALLAGVKGQRIERCTDKSDTPFV